MRRVLALGSGVVLLLALFGQATALGSDPPLNPPINDDFADAPVFEAPVDLATSFGVTVDVTYATREATETRPCGGSDRTVWYAVHSASWFGVVVVEDAGSTAQVKLTTYRSASGGPLTTGACGGGSWISFNLSAGVTTWIQVSDDGTGGGEIRLRFLLLDRPANDTLGTLRPLPVPGSDIVDTRSGTYQSWLVAGQTEFENYSNCGGSTRTFWYRFTAPASGPLTISANTTQNAPGTALLDPVFAVYRSSVTIPTRYAQLIYEDCSATGSLPIDVTAGTEYFIQASDILQSSLLETRGGILAISVAMDATDDVTPPSFAGALPNIEIEVDAVDADGANVSYSVPTAGDEVSGPAPVYCWPASGAWYFLGTTPASCYTIDGAGNMATIRFDVLLTRPEGPFFGPVSDVLLSATDPTGMVVDYLLPWAYDYVDGYTAVACSPASGSLFPLGDTTVTCTTSDTAGNIASVSFHVRIEDRTPPTFLSIPGPIIQEATGADGAVVTFDLPTAHDAVSDVQVTCSPASGALFPLGLTVVGCWASDAAGNGAYASFTVFVEQQIDPNGPVTVRRYDVYGTAGSGFGGWSHPYLGTITNTGRMVGGTAAPSVPVVDEIGGVGYLNDGLESQAQLFTNRNDLAGVPLQPRIVLHLSRPVRVQSIELIGYTGGYSWGGGFVTRATVAIGDARATVDTIGYGPTSSGIPMNDRIDMVAAGLSGITTSTIELTDFVAAWAYGPIDQWSFAEIRVVEVPPDTEPPAISFTGNLASYAVDERVRMTATATDNVDAAVTPSCTLAKDAGAPAPTSCTLDRDAWALGIGHFVFAAAATDAAGNPSAKSASFEVRASYPSVSNLTKVFVSKAGVAKDLASILDAAYALEKKGNLTGEAGKLTEYRAAVTAQIGKSISPDKAQLLITFSYVL